VIELRAKAWLSKILVYIGYIRGSSLFYMNEVVAAWYRDRAPSSGMSACDKDHRDIDSLCTFFDSRLRSHS
jgi:hypothetical protein